MINIDKIKDLKQLDDKILKGFVNAKYIRLSPYELHMLVQKDFLKNAYEKELEKVVELFVRYITLHEPTSFDTFTTSMCDEEEVELLFNYGVLPTKNDDDFDLSGTE